MSVPAKLPYRLGDFGLSPRGRLYRDRLSAMGYRLGRGKYGQHWTIYKSWFGAEDELMLESSALDGIQAWLERSENAIIERADLAGSGNA